LEVRTLLRVPDLIVAVEPLIGYRVAPDDIFQLIGSSIIEPFGIIQRMPVFGLEQIAEVADKLKTIQNNPKDKTSKESIECSA
jgi:hypothetical protein